MVQLLSANRNIVEVFETNLKKYCKTGNKIVQMQGKTDNYLKTDIKTALIRFKIILIQCQLHSRKIGLLPFKINSSKFKKIKCAVNK